MTQWIASVLKKGMRQQTVVSIVSDGLYLHIQKVSHSWTPLKYVLMLDLRSHGSNQFVRVVDLRSDSPEKCTALLGQIISITNQINLGNAAATSAIRSGQS